MKKINWGIIGLGRVAELFSDGFEETENAKLLAVASKDTNRLDYFKGRYKLENRFLFKDYNDLLSCKDIDIVYLALPNSIHHYWIIESIKFQKNVLVEKPALLNFEHSRDIQKNLLNKNLFFSEAFMYRYLPQIELIIKIIKNNDIGNLISMDSTFGVNLLTKKKFFFFNKKKKN